MRQITKDTYSRRMEALLLIGTAAGIIMLWIGLYVLLS